MESIELRVHNGDRVVTDLTVEVTRFCTGRGDGLVNVFAPHATAGLALIETGAGSDADLATTLTDLLPRDDRYQHRHGAHGHGADHVLPAIVSPSLTVPVLGGEPGPRHLAEHRPRRHERRQPRPHRPPQLPPRLTGREDRAGRRADHAPCLASSSDERGRERDGVDDARQGRADTGRGARPDRGHRHRLRR